MHIGAMSYAHVGLLIDVGADPIEGFVTTESGGQPQPFHGWVELAAAIEIIRAATPQISAPAAGAETATGA